MAAVYIFAFAHPGSRSKVIFVNAGQKWVCQCACGWRQEFVSIDAAGGAMALHDRLPYDDIFTEVSWPR